MVLPDTLVVDEEECVRSVIDEQNEPNHSVGMPEHHSGFDNCSSHKIFSFPQYRNYDLKDRNNPSASDERSHQL
jgi:hypothetical protein